MTPEQEKLFYTYGCGSRCLIKLSELHGRSISKADFLEKFLPKYDAIWKGKELGGTVTSTLFEMAKDLGLCTHADARTDPDLVRATIGTHRISGVLVNTDRDVSEGGAVHSLLHCRLFRGFDRDSSNWALWEPYQDGTERDLVLYSDQDLRLRCAHFLLFYQ